MSTSKATAQLVDTFLTRLRNDPNEAIDNKRQYLDAIYDYIAEHSKGHLICDKASPTVVEASKYSLKLIDFAGTRAEGWRLRLRRCLHDCILCCGLFEWLKEESRIKYMSCFAEQQVDKFFGSVLRWEVSIVIDTLNTARLSAKPFEHSAGIQAPDSISKLPSAVVYFILCNLRLLQDKQIMPLFQENLPIRPFKDWPLPAPPGLLFLIMASSLQISQWARQQAEVYQTIPMPLNMFSQQHKSVLSFAVTAIEGSSDLPCSQESSSLWQGLWSIFRFVPNELLTSDRHDLRKLIVRHLHDRGRELMHVLACFISLLKRIGDQVWVGEAPEYAQVVFDSLKDNPALLTPLQHANSGIDGSLNIGWIRPFLNSVAHLPIYSEILAKATSFMCEELQHDRFKDKRPAVMHTAAQILLARLRKSSPAESKTIGSILDIHANTFMTVAFARSHSDERWFSAQKAARELIMEALDKDIVHICSAIELLHGQLISSDFSPPAISIRRQMWRTISTVLQCNDLAGITAMINLSSRIAHLDLLHEPAYQPSEALRKKAGEAVYLAALRASKAAVADINQGLKDIHQGVFAALSKVGEDSISAALLEVLWQPDAVKYVIMMMLSPIQNVQSASQGLVGVAFDVDSRGDCFRALLENSPGAALDGLFDYMKTFCNHATVFPEACSLSKSLVRCLTDILDVLCANPQGLLHNLRFLRPEDPTGPLPRLAELWQLMTRCITVIFKRTPEWSKFFDAQIMIVWMRDALIFGRDLLAQREIIESAASSDRSHQSSIKGSMLISLQSVLYELCRWLRLTDEELLHQSFSLLQSLLDCFSQAKTGTDEDLQKALQKLRSHVQSFKKAGVQQSRLDASRIIKLEAALAAFDDDELEVEILPGDPSSEVEIISEAEVVSEPEIVSRAVPSKASSSATMKVKVPLAHPKTMSEWLGRPQPSKPKKFTVSNAFTPADKAKLHSITSMPSFRKRPVSIPPATTSRAASSSSSRAPDADSSENSSDDDDEGPGSLTQLSNLQKTSSSTVKPPVPVAPQPRRQIKVISDPRLTHDPRQERAKREAARRKARRRNPDITPLHRVLLSWDYDFTGSDPPSFDMSKLRHIPDKFANYVQYRDVFEPLLLLECWSQIIDSKQQNPERVDFRIVARRFVDDWIDLDITPSNGPPKKDWYLNETDVVLLRHPDGKKCIMAKVQQYKSTPLQSQALLRCYLPSGVLDPGLQINSVWILSKIFSLSTLHREYAALVRLDFADANNVIYSGRLPARCSIDEDEIRRTVKTYSVNEPQARAVCASLQTDGFTLIQGPPGTGKTSTICALVDAFMAFRPKPTFAVNVGRTSTAADKAPVQKILICAPSNAAIDEVSVRIRDGSRKSGKGARLNVVRLGAENAMNVSVKDITLDYFVEQKMSLEQKPDQSGRNEETALRAELDMVKRDKEKKQEELSSVHDNSARVMELQEALRKLNSKRISLTQQLDRLRDRRTSEYRSLDGLRRKLRTEILNEADVICSTLSGCGHEQLDALDFEMIIIDEAAQAVELSSLIPLKFNSRRCVMVGDPQQLPPTVLSDTAKRHHYDQSLFVRFHKLNPSAAHLLSIQYRMHPSISQLPSRVFYNGALRDGPDMATKTKQVWQENPRFGIYRFFDLAEGREETTRTYSLKNITECQAILALYSRLRQEYTSVDFDRKIGIVSMYKAQVIEIRRIFVQRYGQDIVGRIDFHTVDGFQGQEKDIIILSCVRAGPGVQRIGFLSDRRRINVAMTRAKSSLFIVGHAATLERSDTTWKEIITDAKERSLLISANAAYFTESNLPRALAPLRTKSKATTALVLPDDLQTPKQLKLSTNQRHVSSMAVEASLMQTNIASDVAMKSTNNIDSSTEKPQLQKRKVEAIEPLDFNPMASSSITPPDASIQQPLPKKPRTKAAANLFIPKSHNKQRS